MASISTMGRFCIAFGCHNSNQKGFSLFQFPADEKLKKAWILQVQKTRDKWHGPTKNSAVCSEHFTEDCFEPMSVMSKKMGMKMRQRLKPDAIPTIFKRPSATPKRLRVSLAAEKRERARVSKLNIDCHIPYDYNAVDTSRYGQRSLNYKYKSRRHYETHE